jgi:hypothetical protein
MPDARQPDLWVVYINGGRQAGGLHSICRKCEWDQLERAQPGRHTLLQSGIATEAEAETVARASLVAAEDARAADLKHRRQQQMRAAREAR